MKMLRSNLIKKLNTLNTDISRSEYLDLTKNEKTPPGGSKEYASINEGMKFIFYWNAI